VSQPCDSLISCVICTYYAGEASFEVKVEADSNDITEHPHDDIVTIQSTGKWVWCLLPFFIILQVMSFRQSTFLTFRDFKD